MNTKISNIFFYISGTIWTCDGISVYRILLSILSQRKWNHLISKLSYYNNCLLIIKDFAFFGSCNKLFLDLGLRCSCRYITISRNCVQAHDQWIRVGSGKILVWYCPIWFTIKHNYLPFYQVLKFITNHTWKGKG